MIQKIKILVEYKKSKQWGFNPHVFVSVHSDSQPSYEKFKTSSSGAGYDKTSDALARALNKSQAIQFFLEHEYKNFVYGADQAMFATGGVGMRSTLEVFEKNGFNVEFIEFDFENSHSKAYLITRK